MNYNYFDFSNIENSYSQFLIYNDFRYSADQFVTDYSSPDQFCTNYYSYTEKQREDIDRQFAKQFDSWLAGRKITYTPTQYIEAVERFLPKIQQLPESLRQKIVQNVLASVAQIDKESGINTGNFWFKEGINIVKHLKTRSAMANQMIQKLMGLPEWNEIRSYFYSHPVCLSCLMNRQVVERMEKALALFDENMVAKAMEEDLFNLKEPLSKSVLPVSNVTLVLDGLKNPTARQMFFQSALESYDCWVDLFKECFPSNGGYYLSGETEIRKGLFTDDMPGERFIRKMLDYFPLDAKCSRIQIKDTFQKELKGAINFNQSFAQYVAEQIVLYSAMLKDQEGIEFYPPIKKMVVELKLDDRLQALREQKFPLHYTSSTQLEQYFETYE